MPLKPRKPHKIWLRFLKLEWKSTKPLRDRDKLLPSRHTRLTSSMSKNTMLTSKPPLPEKLLMLMLPGKLNTMLKRDSHSIPQQRPGPPTCQTMLLRMLISTSKHQLQSRRFSMMPPKLNKLLKTRPTHQRRRLLPQLKVPLPHHSFNSTRAETLLKRDQRPMRASHLDLNHPQDHHHQTAQTHPPTE